MVLACINVVKIKEKAFARIGSIFLEENSSVSIECVVWNALFAVISWQQFTFGFAETEWALMQHELCRPLRKFKLFTVIMKELCWYGERFCLCHCRKSKDSEDIYAGADSA